MFRIFDGFVKSQKTLFFVIPAEAGIQSFQDILDSGSLPPQGQASFSGSDDLVDFLQAHHI